MSKNIVSAAILVTVITFASRLTGFLRDVVLAATYGTSLYSDTYLMAQSVIQIMTGIMVPALGTTFIPVMSDYILHKSKQDTNRFLDVVYTVTIGMTVLISLLGLLFTEQLVRLFTPNFPPEALTLTVELTRIMIPMVTFNTILALNSAKLQNHGNYIAPAMIGIPLNVLLIGSMLLVTDYFGVQGLAVSLVVATFGQVLLLYPYSRKLGYRFHFNLDLKEEGLRRIGILIIPIMIGSGIQQINALVDRVMASGLPEGSIAALNFSNRLSLFVIGLLSAAVVSVFYTSMSNYFAAGQSELFKKLLRNTINIALLITLPVSVGFIVLRLPIIQIVFERGMFDRTASELTAVALLFYTIGLAGFLLRDVVTRAFFAIKETKAAMINGSMAVVLNIILSLVLVPSMGLGGLALATSISGIVATLLLMHSLHRKIGNYGWLPIAVTFVKVCIASLVMGIAVHYSYAAAYALVPFNLAAVPASILCGMLVYALGIHLLRVEEMAMLREMVARRLKPYFKSASM